ncbi:hypothetical protein [Flavobacterium sp. 3HN19-14]|uniref:hypothetical protein n=1 Tax=Flavobacterium sp. 3HN19-14 TaxID=3448133 RepID=UPI003EE16E5E
MYPSTGTSNVVYITKNITLNGTNNADNVVIDNGGTLSTSTVTPTFTNLTVKTGGTFNKESNGMIVNGILEVEDNATFTFKHTNGNAISVWNGTEKFHANSNFYIKVVDNTSNSLFMDSKDDVSEYNGACFGNVIVDVSAGKLQLLPKNFTKTLAAGNLIFKSNTDNMRICEGNYSTTIKGNLIIEPGYGSNSITELTTAGTSSITVNGDFTNSGTSAFRLTNSNTEVLNATLNVLGNITISGTGANIDMDGNATTTLHASTSTINIGGDLTVGASSLLRSSNTVNQGIFNFNGTGDGLTAATTQTISIASAGTTRNQYIDFYAKAGSYVQLINQNLELGKNATFTVNGSGSTGGVLDFNFNGSTPLNITSYSTGSKFTAEQAATLKISSPDGISATSGTTGNVQTTNAPVYNSVAKYHYIGKTNQVPGTGLPAASSAKFVIIELGDNTKTFTLSGNVGISSATTLDAQGGRLEIRKGIVMGTSTADFTGTGRLVMSDGEYNIASITAAPLTNYLPQLAAYSRYSLTGGTINLSGNNAMQILSGTPAYYNLTTSGSNTLGTDYKAVSNGTTVNGTIKVTENSILNARTYAIGGTATNFSMTGNSRYITDGAGDKPDAGGTYSLAPTSTIEFANSSGAGVVRLRTDIGSDKLCQDNCQWHECLQRIINKWY